MIRIKNGRCSKFYLHSLRLIQLNNILQNSANYPKNSNIYAVKCGFINLLVADKVAVGNDKEAALLVVAADTSVIGTDFAGETEGTAVVAYHSHCHS